MEKLNKLTSTKQSLNCKLEVIIGMDIYYISYIIVLYILNS